MTQAELPTMPYQPTIRLKDFEGPLDLLLHLIRQSKMDIYDIPIAEITKQYMDYLKESQRHRLEIAGDYFVMAATLMSIKSRMLLPKPPVAEDEPVAEEDPRQELVNQLLEYQRYKEAAKRLQGKEAKRQQEYTRQAAQPPEGLVHEQVAPGVSLDQLQAAFEKVLRRHIKQEPVTTTVAAEPITVAERMDYVTKHVDHPVRFVDLFEDDVSRDNLVTTFMAILELCRHAVIRLSQTDLFGPLIVLPGPKRKDESNG